MYEQIVIAVLPVKPIIIVVAGLVLAAVIAGGAVFLLRSNKKKASDANAANSASNWQPQMQAQGQGQAGAQSWGQPAMGGMPGQADAWGQQAGGWGQPQQGQQANPWGAQQGQPGQAAGWGADAQGQQANSWGAQQAGGWGQPQQQGQGASPWDAAAMAAPQDPWGQAAAGQQQGWGQPQQAQQAQQAPTAYGAGSNPSWNQPSFPGAQAAPADAWGGAAAGQYQGQPGAAAAWQQPQQQGYGAAAMGGQNAGYADGDKTMLRAPGSATGIGLVRVEEGKEPGKVYEIRKDALSIGRSRESDIFLEDLAVSRFHASILNLGNGNYALKDEGSANGTKVNGQLVNKYQTYPLQEGDHIQLGQTVLAFSRH